MVRWITLGVLAGALAAAAPASAAIVTLTFTGVTNNNAGYPPPWGFDAFGQNIVGDPYTATLNFDLSQGTIQTFGGEKYFTASGGYSGAFTVNGHTYDPTGSTSAVYLRSSQAIELIIYDDPHANTGLVLYAPLTNTTVISNSLSGAIPTLTLNPLDVAASGDDVVLPLDGGALYAFEDVRTLTVSAAPEPATWAIMLVSLGLAGCALRRGSPIALA